MNKSKLTRTINLARKRKLFSLRQLDEILADDDSFDANAERLNLHLDLAVEEERVEDGVGMPVKKNGSVKRPPLNASGQSFYSYYISELRRRPKMDREGEKQYSKRIEFFKQRMLKRREEDVKDVVGYEPITLHERH